MSGANERTRRGAKRLPIAVRRAIYNARLNGAKVIEIARIFGVAISTVSKISNDHELGV